MFIDSVRINIKEIKFDDMTVTFQSRYPRSPTINRTAYKQLIIGAITQIIFLNIMIKVTNMNIRTPKPKLIRSLLDWKVTVISSVIMGIPPSRISYLSFEYEL